MRLGQYEVVEENESTGEKTQFKFHHSSKLQGGASLNVRHAEIAHIDCKHACMCSKYII